MYKKQVEIKNPTGLHARPASDFVNTASRFASHVTIRPIQEANAANAKSMVMLLSLGINRGMTVELCAEGPDEQQAVETLAELILSCFGE